MSERTRDKGGKFDEGREFVETHLIKDEERPDSYELRLNRLEDEVDELNRKFETLLDRIEEKWG